MDVSREEVLACARLAHLGLEDEGELEALRRDMTLLLTHAESLRTLDLEGVPPFSLEQRLPRREDEARPSLSQGEALAHAPAQARGHFLVPKVL